jgi:predicted tellurium resistance membrane protein TerC
MEFTAGYLIEKSLSVDNLFVFIMIFNFFHIPARLQHTILFWGILGALIMRALFIVVGVALIQKFSWVIYIFGGFLIYTGIKMAFKTESQIDPEKNPVFRFAQRTVRGHRVIDAIALEGERHDTRALKDERNDRRQRDAHHEYEGLMLPVGCHLGVSHGVCVTYYYILNYIFCIIQMTMGRCG